MSKINILDAAVYNLISAGEVVERPASVVKELIENSIDSDCQSIIVSVKEGGIKEICVIDDGCGIDAEDLKKCFLPHATSKLKKAQDLEKIATLGFRGEALPSIAAVAQVTLSSKISSQQLGNYIVNNGGNIVDFGQTGHTDGTKIVVKNLFYNTPVRYKFLKSSKQELSYIVNIMQQLIFANPHIKIKLISDDKILLESNGNLESCLYTVFGKETANQMIFFNSEFSMVRISGYVGNRFCSKSNRNSQIIIVNGRAVSDSNIQIAVAQAYGGSLMKRQYPVFAISIELDFDQVDVNVHPNKIQVRFRDNHMIFSCVYKAVSLALAKNESVAVYSSDKIIDTTAIKHLSKNTNNANMRNDIVHDKSDDIINNSKSSVESKHSDLEIDNKAIDNINSLIKSQQTIVDEYNANNMHSKSNSKSVAQSGVLDMLRDNRDSDTSSILLSENNINIAAQSQNNKNNSPLFNYKDILDDKLNKVESTLDIDNSVKSQLINDASQTDFEKINLFSQSNDQIPIVVVGQIFNTYLIIQKGDTAYLIDQHACHERLLYDKLIDMINSQMLITQDLLTPYVFETSNDQYDYILSILEELNQLGFVIEEFGDFTFKISTVPNIGGEINLGEFVNDLLSVKKFVVKSKAELIKNKLAQTACKAAIKGGDKLSEQQINALISDMHQNKILQCPHGRPAIIEFNRKDLDKMFKRIV